jgi:protein SCO1/2
MVSITIDPEHDTPERLRRYARRFGAAEDWDFYTGDLQDIIRVQKAFDAFRGDKMSHIPLTFLRAAPDEPWIRMEGFANAGELIEEYRSGVPADLAQTID